MRRTEYQVMCRWTYTPRRKQISVTGSFASIQCSGEVEAGSVCEIYGLQESRPGVGFDRLTRNKSRKVAA